MAKQLLSKMQDLSVDKTVDGVNKSYLDPMVTSDVIARPPSRLDFT